MGRINLTVVGLEIFSKWFFGVGIRLMEHDVIFRIYN